MANALRYDGVNQFTQFTADPFHQNRTQYRLESKFTSRDLNAPVYFVGRSDNFSSYISLQTTGDLSLKYNGTAIVWSNIGVIKDKQHELIITRDGDDHELFLDGQTQGVIPSSATSTNNVNVNCRASNVYSHADIEYIQLYDAPVAGALVFNWSSDDSDRTNTGLQPELTDTVSGNNAVGSNFVTNGNAWVVLADPPIKTGEYNLSLTPDLFDIVGNVGKWVFDNNNDLSVVTHSGKPVYNPAGNGSISFVRADNDGMESRANLLAPQTNFTYLPNGAQAPNPSGGFTCTGLFKLANNNWLVGNHGQAVDDATPNTPSLVILSNDFTTIVDEWDMSVINGSNSIQGVIQANDGTYYFASPVTGNIFNVTNTGTLIGSFSVGANVNGLAYDSVNNYIWYSITGSTIATEYDLTGGSATGKVLSILDNTDQLFYQASTQLLYCTAGANGTNGSINVVDTVVGYTVAIFIELEDCQAIEGIHVEGTELVISNDGGFHTNADPARSMILEYSVNLDQMYATRANNLYIKLKGNLTGLAPANREALLQQSDPLTTNVGGWALYAMSTDRIRFEARNHFDDSNFYVEYDITRGVDFDFEIQLNTDIDTVEATLNSTPITPDGSFNNISDLTGGLNAGLMDIGLNQQGTQYPSSIDISQLVVTNDPSFAIPLTPDNTSQVKSAQVVSISQTYSVTPVATSQVKSSDVVSISQTYNVVPDSTQQSKAADVVSISAGGTVTPLATSQSKTSEVVNLSQTYSIAPDSTSQGKSAEVALISLDGILSVVNTSQGKTASVVVLVTDEPVVPAFTYSSTTAEQVLLGTLRSGYLTSQISIKDAITSNIIIN